MELIVGMIVQEVVAQAVPIAATAMVALVGLVTGYVRRYVNSKVNTDRTRLALEGLTTVVEAVVGELAQTARTMAKDGLSRQEAEDLKTLAFRRIAAHLPSGVGTLLDAAVGDVSKLIERQIEAQVLRTKAQAAQVQMARECAPQVVNMDELRPGTIVELVERNG